MGSPRFPPAGQQVPDVMRVQTAAEETTSRNGKFSSFEAIGAVRDALT